jgi:AcrR family transcriptional regulator
VVTSRLVGGKLASVPEAYSVYYTEGTSGLANELWMNMTSSSAQGREATVVHETREMPQAREAPGVEAPHRMRADAQRSRAKLLAAATVAFMNKGADAPLEEIARQAGVGIGTLYRHFPTRLDLQEAVFRNQVQAVCAEGEELVSWPSAGEAFVRWLQALAGYLATKRGLTAALVAADGAKAEVVSSCSMAIRSTAERLLARAQESGEVREDVDPTELMMLIHGVIVASELHPEKSDRLMTLLLEGIRR